ncbi:flagellar protein FlaG [Alkalibaculum sporogenes]|nr:flagellar protein FlaG [Alkalibaculum sporogenes]
MIYITRPAAETHKTVPRTAEKSLDNNLKDRRPTQQITEYSKPHRDTQEFERENLERAVKDTNRVLFSDENEHFEFKVHERTGRMMVKLINRDTKEVIKEIPPEKILDLVASIWDLVGILVDERG